MGYSTVGLNIYRQHRWKNAQTLCSAQAEVIRAPSVLALHTLDFLTNKKTTKKQKQQPGFNLVTHTFQVGLLQDVAQWRFIKALWNSTDISQWPSNLICRGGEQQEQHRSDTGREWGYSAGVGEREKPEDPSYLLLLAAARTKKGLNTFFVCLIANNDWFKSTQGKAMATDFVFQPWCGINIVLSKRENSSRVRDLGDYF